MLSTEAHAQAYDGGSAALLKGPLPTGYAASGRSQGERQSAGLPETGGRRAQAKQVAASKSGSNLREYDTGPKLGVVPDANTQQHSGELTTVQGRGESNPSELRDRPVPLAQVRNADSEIIVVSGSKLHALKAVATTTTKPALREKKRSHAVPQGQAVKISVVNPDDYF